MRTMMHLFNEHMQPLLSGCTVEAEGAAADAAGAGGGTSAGDGKQPAAAEKTFTQAEVDRLTAESRRQGREAGIKRAKAETDAIVIKTRDALLEQFRAEGIIKPAGAAAGAQAGAEAAPAAAAHPAAAAAPAAAAVPGKTGAAPADDATAALRAEMQRELASRDEALKAERAARLKLEREREREVNERKQAQDTARREQVITEIAASLKSEAGLPDGITRGLAKVMLAEGKVSYDDKRVLYVTDERDPEDDDSVIKLPLKDGISAWGKTAAADEYRPAVKPGSGSGDRGRNSLQAQNTVKLQDMNELERWKHAEQQNQHIFNQERARAQRT